MGRGRGLVRRTRRLVSGSRVLGSRRVVTLVVVLRGCPMGFGGLLVVVSSLGMRLWLLLGSGVVRSGSVSGAEDLWCAG